MSWHSTIESALGLTHVTEVVRCSNGRWYVQCETCDDFVTASPNPSAYVLALGWGNPETAATVAKRHTERFSLVMPS